MTAMNEHRRMDMANRLQVGQLTDGDIEQRRQAIYRELLKASKDLDKGNFDAIHDNDLQRLFDLYDRYFFDGHINRLIEGIPPLLTFRLSRRMTRAAGHTAFRRYQTADGEWLDHYEIVVAIDLLFDNFDDNHRTIRMSGEVCKDRLSALQRIMEHEMVHLLEFLVWGKSSCSRERFQGIVRRFFGHRIFTHDLITVGERASVRHGIRPGSRVRFVLDGKTLEGMVNRITRRATVLVEDENGKRYSDGRCYRKYYVPLPLLEVV